VSFAVAAFLAVRWWRRRRERAEDHVLDRFVRALTVIEARQMKLDDTSADDTSADDIEALQTLLDEVTRLRMEALGHFSVHQLSEDQGVDLFLEMCHALSAKISDKLTRQRFDRAVGSLLEAQASESTAPRPRSPQGDR
jgi:hypothetical protein